MNWQIYGVWTSLMISLIGLGLIVWRTAPQTASTLIKSLFFIAVFIFTWSVATSIIFSIKNRLVKSRALSQTAYEPIFYDSFLKAFLLSMVFMLVLLIKRFF